MTTHNPCSGAPGPGWFSLFWVTGDRNLRQQTGIHKYQFHKRMKTLEKILISKRFQTLEFLNITSRNTIFLWETAKLLQRKILRPEISSEFVKHNDKWLLQNHRHRPYHTDMGYFIISHNSALNFCERNCYPVKMWASTILIESSHELSHGGLILRTIS